VEDLEFGNVEQRKRAFLDELQGLDVAEDQMPLYVGRAIEDVVTIELENTALLEEMCWR
jgi:hypothetical protein